ncbi:RrF2 family transcriptional regulator [Thauera sinica]|uniref:RrF2 family transcriptional regulator n=1 Tax=Thauera sinica TaxID=2665146 RepID=A0ABW1AQ98_9RHOO|nr:Rrf2 family transcriptional regulator [Thauera sp. K11]ATE62219.1 BadM/Rrf2 family transcriptional regulator [Thauera sp. K11]
MQITRFTDLSLRVLMYLTVPPDSGPVTIDEIATRFDVSRHHLAKVVHRLGQSGWIVATRGKGGGLALAQPPSQYRLGEVVRELEGGESLIDCTSQPCVLLQGCNVRAALNDAQQAFYERLDTYTLADVVRQQTATSIIALHRGRRPSSPVTA